ncbi:tail fiber protein [Pseudomonas sp. GL-B-16]|uniref:tail fiber protein n=1 Tax=Pseudomonas sp. GL-B-16 TaxID=2832373 RepID=UPI001CBE958F|nr:tail fiber protein [Pseudomonas sp. GL-B-16]
MARQPFNTRWAQGVETEDSLNSFKAPGDVRLGTGWEGGQDKDAPPAGHENWWHNRVDSALQGVERHGVMDWHPQAQYGLGAPTYGNDGNYYESLVAGNVGNDPTLTSGFWRYAGSAFFSAFPVGAKMEVFHNGVPDAGWLKTSGALLLRSSYPRLFAKIGTAWNTGGETSLQFRLPDTRGVVPRGFDDGRGLDPDRVFGSYQADQNKEHYHNVQGTPGIGQGVPGADTVQQSSGLTGTSLSGGSEARMKNITTVTWIKY